MLMVATVRKTERDLTFFAAAVPTITPLGNAKGKELKEIKKLDPHTVCIMFCLQVE